MKYRTVLVNMMQMCIRWYQDYSVILTEEIDKFSILTFLIGTYNEIYNLQVQDTLGVRAVLQRSADIKRMQRGVKLQWEGNELYRQVI